jgi:pyruvyltransferase
MASDGGAALEPSLFWWQPSHGINFGDYLSKVIVERMAGGRLPAQPAPLSADRRLLFAVGSIIHFARDGDIVWGAGFREPPLDEPRRYRSLDVRAVRGPLSRDYLLRMGITCPAVYGDPALLLPRLCPELPPEDARADYIVIPNCGEADYFRNYRRVVLPTQPWAEVVRAIRRSRLVVSSSLHGLVVAEAFGVPARLLKMTWIEPLLKYEDYYAATGRERFMYATSVGEALEMGAERPGVIDLQPLVDSFPGLSFPPLAGVARRP